jgi:Flp pilus assembly protein TadB
MLYILLFFVFLAGFGIVLSVLPLEWEQRPNLETLSIDIGADNLTKKKKRGPLGMITRQIAVINSPICRGSYRERIIKDLSVARINIQPEEFLLIKEIVIILTLIFAYSFFSPEKKLIYMTLGFAFGYILPDMWLRGKVNKSKAIMVRELPDAIDLLGLCVNAGLDFMLSLKWVVERARKSIVIDEFVQMFNEINVGKPRREAIKAMALRYNITDLSTFARTLIQADKMGTSMVDALNMLAEDMRLSRFRRGEQMALKAPMKMLVPLLLFIFPVVAVLVAGPIMLDFVENNPFGQIAGQ